MADQTSTLSPVVYAAIQTFNDDRTPITGKNRSDLWRKQWDEIIDSILIEWGKNPSLLADPDEGIPPPTPQCIRLANQLALAIRDLAQPPPSRVVPDGEGGVSFESVAGEKFQSLNVRSDCTVELLTFWNCHLVARSQIR